MKLSPNFSLAEMIRTSHRRYNNTPGKLHVFNLGHLCVNVLQPIRDRFGVPLIVTSGYRSPAVNDAVGSNDKSQHVKGEAADFHVSGVNHFLTAQWIVEHLEWDQLILEFCSCTADSDSDNCGGWLHISYTAVRRNRHSILRAKRTGGKVSYLPLSRDLRSAA